MKSYTSNEIKDELASGKVLFCRDSRVYDVSEFVTRHPGGAALLHRHAGHELGGLLRGDKAQHDHSSAAFNILEKYLVGNLVDATDSAEVSQKATSTINQEDNFYMAGWKEQDLIDWDLPLLWQVGRLGKDYIKWVHSPVDKKIRFFESDLLENLSTCSWYMVPIVWVPVVSVYLVLSFTNFFRMGPELWLPWLLGGGIWLTMYHMPFLLIAGVVMWSFLEYVIHRWCFHHEPPATSPFLITLHFLIHGQHHKAPMDKGRLVFPPVPASFFGLVISAVYLSVFPRAMAQCLLAGTGLGYILYDLTHYYLHHGSPSLPYFMDLKRIHVQHHFTHQDKGFGISSKLWDYPFRTVMPDGKL